MTKSLTIPPRSLGIAIADLWFFARKFAANHNHGKYGNYAALTALMALANGGMASALPLETPKSSVQDNLTSSVTVNLAAGSTSEANSVSLPTTTLKPKDPSRAHRKQTVNGESKPDSKPNSTNTNSTPAKPVTTGAVPTPRPTKPPSNSPKQAPNQSPNQAPSQTPSQTPNNKPTTPVPQPNPQTLIPVRQIRVVGNTILTEAEIRSLTAPLEGKSVTISQLREVADKITQIYQERNYITSRAIIPADQVIRNGIVTIQVLEGSLENVEIRWAGNNRGRLNEDYIRQRVLIGAKTPLNFSRLEEDLQLLRSDPLIGDLRANLTRSVSNAPDKSVIQLAVTEAPSFSTRAFIDNYGSTTTGIFRFGVGVQELNLTGAGDALSANYTRSGTANAYAFSYVYPVSNNGGTLSLNASLGNNPISDPQFAGLNIATDSQVYELAYRQPLVRTTREELALGLSFSVENSASTFNGQSFNFQNQQFGDGASQARVFRFTQEYVERDLQGAWALRSSLNLGVEGFGATIRTDGTPDGRFFSWNGQLLRVQRVSADRDSLLSFRLNTQLTGDRLMALNRFSVGGMYSVRGYRQNQLTGDSGIQGSIEWQMSLVRDSDGVSFVKILPFIESGVIWNTRGVPTNPSPQVLASIGTGLIYQPMKNIVLRLDYGLPLIDAKNPGTNLQDSGLYFSINGSF
jgi:hemolysin activation/secretion protein